MFVYRTPHGAASLHQRLRRGFTIPATPLPPRSVGVCCQSLRKQENFTELYTLLFVKCLESLFNKRLFSRYAEIVLYNVFLVIFFSISRIFQNFLICSKKITVHIEIIVPKR
uniref:Uncharacterized protein n=1 Tax=Cacopsylla melanoneura TaxID=428564 RepID=A0A8D8U3C4_9HEMI